MVMYLGAKTKVRAPLGRKIIGAGAGMAWMESVIPILIVALLAL
jgi:hypothetical protein